MKIDIEKTAQDSRISIEDVKRLYADLFEAKKTADKLDELHVDRVELFTPDSLATELLRDDKVNNQRESISFKNAPNMKNNCIVVPKIKGV